MYHLNGSLPQYTINKSKLILGYVGPEWKQRIVAEIDSSMNKWLDSIPAHRKTLSSYRPPSLYP